MTCSVNCSRCWHERHSGHDVGSRHEDGRLYSATCHDCDERYYAPHLTAVVPGVTDEGTRQ